MLTEKVCDQPESSLDRERIVEFSSPTWQVSDSVEMDTFRILS